jgi:anhydro-N-acetylmuramic acid kinase
LPELLAKMLNEPFFALPPPKSSGRDLFNMDWLRARLTGEENPQDVQRTLLELTCKTIADAIKVQCMGAREIYLCGGGAHNTALFNRLAAMLPESRVQATGTLGVNSDFLEAIAFAWLARQCIRRIPANLPVVTGAKHPCVLGAVYPA